MLENNISKMSYEEAISALEKIINELESGSVSLDKSIELYTKGAKLKEHCENKLKSAEEKISEITRNQNDGSININPSN